MQASIEPFAIVSLPRSGSTALFRLLSCADGVRIAYEPDYGESWKCPTELASYCRGLTNTCQGIKHVWDPNGWPFENKSHHPTLHSLSQSSYWVSVNADLLNCFATVVFLRRRNQLARVLSDLLGQQTNLWGHMPTQPHSLQEVAEHREQLSRQQLQPLDEAIIGWYLRYAWEWETQIMAASDTPTRVHVIYYEDLFSPQLPMSARLQCFCTLAAKLGVQLNPQEPRVQTILHSDAKLNTSDTLARIPNYREISERWGSAEFWPGAATPTGGR